MTRRRARQRRAQEVCTQEVRAEEGHGVYRLTRARRRACRIRQARAALVRRGALLLSVSGACLMRAALAAAAAHEVMHEMTGEVQALRDARTQLADYHAAQRNLREARKGVQTAQENLAAAQAGKKEAAQALADARQNLAASREALREAQQALAAARAVAAEKSQAAQSAQQAVADYAPEVEALRSDAAAAAAESARAEGAYEAAAAAAQAAMQRDREAAVAAACEAVGYEQRRLEEAQRLADEALAAMPDRMEEVESSYRGWLDALDASLDASEAALSDAEAQLDDLMSAAEDAAMEAADAQQEAAQAEAEAAQAAAEAAQQEKEEAAEEDDVREAEDWAREAAADLVSAQVWEREAAEQVAHFGEGEGVQAGFEYYSWRGRRAGHQLYLPLSYFASRRQDGHMVDFSLSTGRVASDSGYAGGHVSGFTDTVLGITLHGDHPRDSVRYHFTLNVPTGESRVYQSAVLPEGVAAMTTFGAGWEYIPAVEWLHHFTERDSLDATLSCAWRAAYDYARESPSAAVHPGTQLAEDVSYQHIGERQQTRIGLRHSSTAMARQDTFDYDGWLQGGMEGTVPVSGETRYREGETWGLRWLSNRKITPRDEYFHCLAFDFTNAVHGYDAGKVYEQFASVGVRHTVTPQLHWQAVASYQHVSAGSSDIERRLLTRGEEVGDDLMNGGWSRFGLLARLTWQPRLEEQLTFSLERYVRRDEASVGYHGWGMALWYSRSL